eukprot:15964123-Heterocapsa_arctica.AAC.1
MGAHSAQRVVPHSLRWPRAGGRCLLGVPALALCVLARGEAFAYLAVCALARGEVPAALAR